MKNKFSGILFDLDGTLVDTSYGFIESMKHCFLAYNLTFAEEAYFSERISIGSKGILLEVLPGENNRDLRLNIRECFLRYYSKIVANDLQVYPTLSTSVKKYSDKQIKLGVITNKPRCLAEPILIKTGLSEFMNVVICPEDVRNEKPSPEGILKACNAINVQPEAAVYVGDHSKDIVAAKQAGTASIAVNYGFKLSTDDANKWDADWVCENSSELSTLLNSFVL